MERDAHIGPDASTDTPPGATLEPDYRAASVDELSPLAVRTPQPVFSREDIDDILANLEPLMCSRRKLRQVMCMIVVRVRDQEKLITTQRSHLEQGASVIERLTAQQLRRQSRIDRRTSKIDNMEEEANNYQQQITEFQRTIRLMKARLLTESKVHDDLTSQNFLLTERITKLTKKERARGIDGATAKECQTAKNAYLREKNKQEELKKKLQRYTKLYKVLADLEVAKTPADGDRGRFFEISFVESDGQTDVICKEVPAGKPAREQPCVHLAFNEAGNGDSQGLPKESEVNKLCVGRLEGKEKESNTSGKDVDGGNQIEGDTSVHCHVSTGIHSGASDMD